MCLCVCVLCTYLCLSPRLSPYAECAHSNTHTVSVLYYIFAHARTLNNAPWPFSYRRAEPPRSLRECARVCRDLVELPIPLGVRVCHRLHKTHTHTHASQASHSIRVDTRRRRRRRRRVRLASRELSARSRLGVVMTVKCSLLRTSF